MPRGRKRNQRNRNTGHHTPPAPQGESQRSKAYRSGKAVRYAYRIHGPQYPVTTMTLADLPEESTLT